MDEELAETEKTNWTDLYDMLKERWGGDPELKHLTDEMLKRMDLKDGQYGLVIRRSKTAYAKVRESAENRMPREPYEILSNRRNIGRDRDQKSRLMNTFFFSDPHARHWYHRATGGRHAPRAKKKQSIHKA